jgi:outer membrane receptor protein involved in Fe transport
MFKPKPEHTLRVSYNRAFRSPSLVNNFLEITIANQLDLGLINPALAGRTYTFPVDAYGNEELVEEEMTSYEVGYSGVIGDRVTLSAAFYVNDSENSIFFRQVASYTAQNPPPGWPLPPAVLNLLIAANAFGPGNGLPSGFSYENLGKVRDKGIELGVEAMLNNRLSMSANYSYQAEPEPSGFDISDLNLPPTNRFNVGVNYNDDRFLGAFSVNHQDEAFWQDVLDARYNGTTDPFTTVNGSFGVKWNGDRFVTSVKVNNLFNDEVQQHVFGDVIKRQVVGELRVQF